MNKKGNGKKISPFLREIADFVDFRICRKKEKVVLVLGCSQTTAQRLRQALKSMTKEEVAELVSRRLGIP